MGGGPAGWISQDIVHTCYLPDTRQAEVSMGSTCLLTASWESVYWAVKYHPGLFWQGWKNAMCKLIKNLLLRIYVKGQT